MLARLLPDRFVLWLLAAVALAIAFPVAGGTAAAVDSLTLAAIFSLFFLHGVRLPREALLSGVTDWKLHVAILALTFVAFPLAGLGLAAAFPGLLPPSLWSGLLFLCALPSTVQSSIAYTSIARGNVAGAVAAAAFSNLAGVFLTPLLVALMLKASGVSISAAGIGKIFALLFLPFLLGHGLRPLLLPFVAKRPRLATLVDKGTILLAVYGAFSAATVEGVWRRLPREDLAILAGILVLLLALILAAAWALGRFGGFARPSRAAILFCGSVKGLATGVPMARILFPGPAAGLIILPVMIFHSIQLVICAWIAGAMAQAGKEDGEASAAT
ncbi:bile acid:sodium symporter family protein [Sphingosinicella sp. CPCC 101087]|uniref:bile acid:sodium symporter family protein n=1 Tax=Sphingosinicella sp. CPCC 101087 TaxID=2497754 RepID=UPI00197F41E6|nr:bile acid:sodium symporter family protein [Sphingosinicella sp. CPCC 101087]